MDLLLTPADPAFPTGDTPYLAGEKRWNCGHFASYAGPHPRSAIESLAALPDEELNGFLQTWLFFGLVAEFLGLNEQEDGKHIVDPSQAQSELDELYNESVIIKEDGKSYITGVKVLALVPLIQERITTAAGIAGGIKQRLMYLDHCVCYAHETAFVGTWNEVYKRDEVRVEAFDPAIPYVAISHVWADGLGNPTANALPGCQVDRLTSLVAKLQKSTVDDTDDPYAEKVFFDSTLELPERLERFNCNSDTKLAQLIAEDNRKGLRGKIFAETMTELAEELASEQVTANFIAARDQVDSDEYTLAKVELEERMEELVEGAREARPDFANAVEVVGGTQDRIWDYLAMFAHQIILERTPDDQLWLVD
ncbi:hypothetical protein VSDG_06812 [Cytospora chrysosperma]|uniref:Uncharacterized protein n=1 Tax=Cytospora chrysosperma TaxID=252740 RepID=A0A423VRB9_CYTCH|nr:hypothetical protein VSDG_06812 [Valsa sordida]